MCGCNNKAGQKVVQDNNIDTDAILSQPPFKTVTYKGPEYKHYVGSPTGIITQFGLRNYGSYKFGELMKVHPADIAALPNIFELVTP